MLLSFFGYSLCVAKLLGWRRTGRFFGLTQAIAFICEYASTRIGIPYGEYFYTGSTDHELYLSSTPSWIPFRSHFYWLTATVWL